MMIVKMSNQLYINRFDDELGCALKFDLLREYIQGLDDRGVSWYQVKDAIARSGLDAIAFKNGQASKLPIHSRELAR
jgi:hypothetical protein